MPYRPEVMLNWGANMLMSIANKDDVAKSLASYKFVISFDLFLTESSNFADIVLPDCSYLQSLDSRSNFPFIFSLPAGMGEWCWPIRQPVLPADGEQRPFAEVLLEIADRAGFRADYNAALNASLNLQPPYRLSGETRYTYEQVCDAELKNNFGEEHGLDWFKEHGVIKWKKTPQEVYWRPFVDVRVPIYWEFLLSAGQKMAEICEPRGFDLPMEFYDPLPDFHPCMSHKCEKEGFDFYAFYYRDVVHTNSFTMENAWLDEAARLDPFSYTIAINATAAKKRGLVSGQAAYVETETGRRVKGRLKLTEAIHPEGVGIAAMCGHWSDGMPVAKGKGVFFNDLLEIDWDHVSPVNNNLDLCARVRVVPAETAA
jgi:molybdopterin-containing oxidoreductase family molybdopterin binding subunit